LRLPFLAAGVTVLACMALLAWIEKSGELERGYAPAPTPSESLHGGESFLPATRTLFFFVFCVAGITFSFVPLMVSQEMQETTSLTSRVIALQPLAQVVFFCVFGYWGGWVHKRWPLWATALVLLVATVLLCGSATIEMSGVARTWMFRIGLCLVGVTIAQSFLMNLLYSMERPDTRARNAGIHEAIVGLGMTVGPALGGYGAKLVGNRGVGALWVAAALALCGLVATQIIWWLRCRRVSG
jgi:MFS family permease